MSQTVWYKQFFEEAYPQTQRRKPGRPEAEKEVDFLIRELGLAPGMRVLDLCCGSGYNAIPLARRGLNVVGLDLSERMLEEAAQAGRDAGVTVEWTQADMRDIKWNRAFDAVINMDNSFGYLPDDEENFRVLEGVARALVPGGRFCLHVASYPFLLRHWHARVWHTGDGGWYRLESNKLNLLQSSIDVHCILIRPDGSQSEMDNHLRLFAPHELLAWLRRAGFSRISSYGDLAGTPFSLETAGLVMIGETDRSQRFIESRAREMAHQLRLAWAQETNVQKSLINCGCGRSPGNFVTWDEHWRCRFCQPAWNDLTTMQTIASVSAIGFASDSSGG